MYLVRELRMSNITNLFCYPKAFGLLMASMIIISWLIFFLFKLKSKNINELSRCYKYYCICSLSVFFWILSNCYFYSGLLIYYPESVAIVIATFSNISAYSAFLATVLFSCQMKQLYLQREIPLWNYFIIYIFSIYVVFINVYPGLVIEKIEIFDVGHFVIHFGHYTKHFIIIVFSLSVWFFLNLFSLRKVAKRLNKIKINYMTLSMMIFMAATVLIQQGMTYFLGDFSFTWLPPMLSISEVLLGYALITSRFYSSKYIWFWTVSLLCTVCVYFIPIIIADKKLEIDLVLTYVMIPIVGLTWGFVFNQFKKMMYYLFYRDNVFSFEEIRSLISDARYNPKLAINNIATMLDIPKGNINFVKNIQGYDIFTEYFCRERIDALVLEEIQEKLDFSNDDEVLKMLHHYMTQCNAAIILPVFNGESDISHFLISSHKKNGDIFSNEEIKILQYVIKKSQYYINSKVKLQKYSALASSIAHEVRNPLAQVQSHLEIVKFQVQQHVDEKIIEDELTITMNAITRGNQLIDILLREVNDESMQTTMSIFPVHKLVHLSVDQFGFEDESYRKRVHVQIKDDFFIRVNDVLFSFVLFNLLRNALYYFDSYPLSQIEITTLKNKNQNCILFRDTGAGIPQDIKNKIFEEFYSYDKASGSGLGLSYCQRVMKTFGGAIECESERGQFTEFRLFFPKVLMNSDSICWLDEKEIVLTPEKKEKPVLIVPVPIKMMTASDKWVLVVDDVISQRSLLATQIQQLGYQVIQACNGQEAIAVAQRSHLDLIIMDLNMPIMNGFDATRKIKERHSALPVIAFSGESGHEDAVLINDTMDGRLNKPIIGDELKLLLERYLGLTSN